MPNRPLDPTDFPNWANDIGARLRAVERRILNKEELELLQTLDNGNPLGDTLHIDFKGLKATLVGDRFVEVTGGGKRFATIVVAAADSELRGDGVDFVCTGTADEFTLDEAVAALPDIGGRIVLLEGTYNLTGSWIASPAAEEGSIHIQGMGAATCIRGADSPAVQVTGYGSGISHLRVLECDGDAIYNSASNGYIYSCYASTPLNEEGIIGGRGFVLVGSRSVIHTCWAYGCVGNGIEVNGSESKVIGCDVKTCDGKGIYTTGGETFHSQCRVESVGGKGIHTTGSRGVISGCIIKSPGDGAEGIRCDGGMVVDSCYVESAGGDGFFAIRVGSSPSIVSNCRVVDCVEGGVYGGSSDTIIIGNHVGGVGEGKGIQTDSSDTHTISNRVVSFEIGIYTFGGNISDNRVSSAAQHGIHLRGNNRSSVMDNRILGCGWETTDTYDGIRIEGDEHNIQGNMVRSDDLKYGINVLSGATDNMVTNNDLLNSAITSSFNDAGTGTVTAAGNRV